MNRRRPKWILGGAGLLVLLLVGIAVARRERTLELSILEGVKPRYISQREHGTNYTGEFYHSAKDTLYEIPTEYEDAVRALERELCQERGWVVVPQPGTFPSVLFAESKDRIPGGKTVRVTALYTRKESARRIEYVRRPGGCHIVVHTPSRKGDLWDRAYHAVRTELDL